MLISPTRSQELSETPSTVLLVEDSLGDVAILKRMLEEPPAGFALESASCLRTALERLAAGGISLVITDLSLPDSGSEETFPAMLQRLPDIPVIILSAEECEETAVRMLEKGAQDYLIKGRINRDILVRAIRYALERHRCRRELQSAHDALEEHVAARTRELETALRQLRETQQQLMQQERLTALGRMASGIAHDFNNAITPIIGFSELLLNPCPLVAGKTQEYLRLIHTCAQDSAGIVRRLREFYRYRDEHDVFGPVMLNDLVRQVAALTKPRWRDQAMGRGVHIDLVLDLRRVPAVCGSESELRELLINLIFNAVDAIAGSGTITCGTSVRGREVVLQVSDTGGGMTEEVRQRCLEPFFTTKAEHGTGLGLAMVHGTVRRHDGRLEIESAPGHGTTISLALMSHEETKPYEIEVPALSASGRSLRILVVDDEPSIRDLLVAFLSQDGHCVDAAANGQEALQSCGSGRWDLLITDRAMPGLRGDELARSFRQIDPHLPIILITGFADLMQDVGESPSGIDLVLRKPFTRDSLRGAITQALASHEDTTVSEQTGSLVRVGGGSRMA